MIRFFSIGILVLALAGGIFAQPTAITWQGKLLENSGNAINQNNVAMTFAMFDAATGGNQLWPASGVVTKTVDVVNGLYSVQLGTGTGDDIAFTAAMFDGKTPWLEVKVGTETLPRTEITNVPFALISNDLSASGWENPGEIGKTTPNTGKFTSLETGSVRITDGASEGKVLTSDAEGNASWTTPYTGLTNFTESNFTNDSKTGVKFTPNNAATDVDFVLQPKGTGSILAQQPDGNTNGGNTRGNRAIDFQMQRNQATHVASGNYSVITGGRDNSSRNSYAVVVGGESNDANGIGAIIGGGANNYAGGNGSIVGGGNINSSTDVFSITVGGEYNTSSADYSIIGGGFLNYSTGNYAIVAGGEINTASGYYSVVGGGINNTAPSYGETVFGYNSTKYTVSTNGAIQPNETDRLFSIGNGATFDLESNALTILKNANTIIGGSLTINGNGTNTAYLFPVTRGTVGQVLQTDGSGGTNWTTPYTGLSNFSESNYTYNSKTGVKLLATHVATDVDFVISPKGSGAIIAQQPDGKGLSGGVTGGGNERGANAVDLQIGRILNTHVASGDHSVIIGGFGNTASGNTSFAMGIYSVASGSYSTAMGSSSTASGDYSTATGSNTQASGMYSTTMGKGTIAPSGYEVALGRYNTDYTPVNTFGWDNNDRLFVLGSGTGNATRNDAFTILKSGNTTIGGSLTLNGNGTGTSFTFPTTRGTSGQLLKTAGDGTTSWSALSKSDVGLGNVENTTLSTWTGSANITTLGTIASGTWSGTAISLAKGGTGAATKTAAFDALSPMSAQGDIVYGGTDGTGTRLAKGTAGQVLTMNAGATAPVWSTPTDGTVTNVSGTAPIISSGGNTPAISISAATTSDAGSMSATDKTKLDGIDNGAEVNVNADWNATSGDAQILNKPSILSGTQSGQMQYWNGTAWVTVTAGVNGQLLKYKNGVPTWVDDQLINLNIGDSYQGGVIAYFFQAGDPGYVAGEKHGLIAAVADASNAAWFDWEHIVVISTGTALGTGSANTIAILAAYTGVYNYAAKICANYEYGGYTDWFLPSKDELYKLYLSREAIGGFVTGSFPYYYSSSQSGSMYAWAVDFSNGSIFQRMVQNADRVRPVRVF